MVVRLLPLAVGPRDLVAVPAHVRFLHLVLGNQHAVPKSSATELISRKDRVWAARFRERAVVVHLALGHLALAVLGPLGPLELQLRKHLEETRKVKPRVLLLLVPEFLL